jgi:hypothetical protein
MHFTEKKSYGGFSFSKLNILMSVVYSKMPQANPQNDAKFLPVKF